MFPKSHGTPIDHIATMDGSAYTLYMHRASVCTAHMRTLDTFYQLVVDQGGSMEIPRHFVITVLLILLTMHMGV